MAHPVIGLSTYRESADWGVWSGVQADLLPSQYAAAVQSAGGVPVLLPPQDPAAAAALVGRLDAVLVTGGADVEPGRYGEHPHPATAPPRADRDAWELALLGAADALGLPVLGICRGMQVMAVAGGGQLEQHLPDVLGHEQHSPSRDGYGDVEVVTLEGSRLRGLVGERHEVGCHHHQSVREHPGFVPAAYAADGTLEAMEAVGPRFAVAVQWHPETRADAGLFRGLVAAAATPPTTLSNPSAPHRLGGF